MITEEHFRELCARREGPALDFKEAFYPNSDAGSVEMAKDVIAMANLLPQHSISAAHILVGVRENSDGYGDIVGFSHEPWMIDSNLQQKVKSLLNRTPSFSFTLLQVDGVSVAALTILPGRRPYYALRDKGTLRRNAALIRVGSSTDVASPDEIIEWGSQDSLLRVRHLEAEKLEAEQLVKPKFAPLGAPREPGLRMWRFRLSNEGIAPFEPVAMICAWLIDHEGLSKWLEARHVRLTREIEPVLQEMPVNRATLAAGAACIIDVRLDDKQTVSLVEPHVLNAQVDETTRRPLGHSLLSYLYCEVRVVCRNIIGTRECIVSYRYRATANSGDSE